MKKKFISLITCLALVGAMGLSACNKEKEETPVESGEHEHVWVLDSKQSTAPTCGASGVNVYSCSVSGCTETKTEPVAATGGHSYGGNNVCDVCGYIDMSNLSQEEAIAAHGFYHIDKDNSGTYTVGDEILFGSYPQDLIADGTLYSAFEALDTEAYMHGVKLDEDAYGKLQSFENNLPADGTPSEEWASYGYYSEGEAENYMYYRDVEVDGAKYRGVYLLKYRPYYSAYEASTDGANSYIDEQGFSLGTVYWFEYAPIRWDVLGYSGGRMLLNSQYCLEGQPFQSLYTSNGSEAASVKTPDGGNVNVWETSTLREFLNNEFYNGAFSDAERALIPRVTLNNSQSGFGGNEYQINQNDTEDSVFLLSYKDWQNADYGITTSRSRTFTKYATSQGLRPSTEGVTGSGDPACFYMTRSAGSESYTVTGISKQGTLSYNASPVKLDGESYDGFAVNGDFGVLPALYIEVGPLAWEKHTVTYTHRSGEQATLDYALCFPKDYSEDGDPLPLITYIPDAMYRSQGISKVETAPVPTYWVTEEMMSKYPAVYLILTLTKNSYTDSAAGDYLDGLAQETSEEYQVMRIIDSLCSDYNIDTNRLYLTGQSMGGIFDWAVNHTYPQKFAATVYVACQPGGDVSTEENPIEMYDTIIGDAKFKDQAFVYIASQADPKSPLGQQDVIAALEENGLVEGEDFIKYYDLDPEDPEGSTQYLRENVFTPDCNKYFLGFDHVAGGAGDMNEHMLSFPLCYQIEAVLEWLLSQSL